MINFNAIFQIIGYLLMIVGVFMFLPIGFSIYYNSGDGLSLAISGGITVLVGFIFFTITKNKDHNVQKREGYLIVSMGWVFMLLFSALPYLISQAIPSGTDAFFETVSGMTTTGASILS
ncbi:MAG: TrkH family potassium uptake protein, partial [Saprospiraceae bacterium]|nr:TrkH family potassium uptake protein [Saprospiraceae bacterium]